MARDELCAIVREWWSAVEQGDMAKVASMLTEDMTWEVMFVGQLMPRGGLFQGRKLIEEELLVMIPTLYYVPGQTKFDITALYVDDPYVVMEFTINAITATGRPYNDVKYISVITIEGGKIKYAREYPDALAAKAGHLD
ncbi:MAG: nuclear transport factor 2 family protein [Steroidobacteraceae bacterium]